MKLIFNSLALFVALILTSCSSTPKQPDCVFADGSNQSAPLWVCTQSTNKRTLSIITYADKSATGPNFMQQMAENSARFELAQNLKRKVSRMIKQYAANTDFTEHQTLNEILAQTNKLITSKALKESRIIHKQITPTGGIVIMVYMSEQNLQKSIKKILQQAITKQPRLWQRFKRNQSQQELLNAIINS